MLIYRQSTNGKYEEALMSRSQICWDQAEKKSLECNLKQKERKEKALESKPAADQGALRHTHPATGARALTQE